jgi:hypothetical protein
MNHTETPDKNLKLKLGVWKVGTSTVFIKILHQDESLRRPHTLYFEQLSNGYSFSIKSSSTTELCGFDLFVRGASHETDYDLLTLHTDSRQVEIFLAALARGLAKINGTDQCFDTRTDPSTWVEDLEIQRVI